MQGAPAAMEVITEEEQLKRSIDLAPRQTDAELAASLARGIADMKAGRVGDFDDFMVELGADTDDL